MNGIKQWITSGTITHDQSHVRDFNSISAPEAEVALGQSLAKYLKHEKVLLCCGACGSRYPMDVIILCHACPDWT